VRRDRTIAKPTATRPPFAGSLGSEAGPSDIDDFGSSDPSGLGRSGRREVKYVDSTEALNVLKSAFPDMIG
jgi:hypothetical protein